MNWGAAEFTHNQPSACAGVTVAQNWALTKAIAKNAASQPFSAFTNANPFRNADNAFSGDAIVAFSTFCAKWLIFLLIGSRGVVFGRAAREPWASVSAASGEGGM